SGTIPPHAQPPAEITTENTMNIVTTESRPAPEALVSAAPESMDEIGSKSRSGSGVSPKREPYPAETKSASAVASRPLPPMLNAQESTRPQGITNLLNGAQPRLLSDGFR